LIAKNLSSSSFLFLFMWKENRKEAKEKEKQNGKYDFRFAFLYDYGCEQAESATTLIAPTGFTPRMDSAPRFPSNPRKTQRYGGFSRRGGAMK